MQQPAEVDAAPAPAAPGPTAAEGAAARAARLVERYKDSISNLALIRMVRSLAYRTFQLRFEHGFKESLAQPGGRERLAQALRDNPPVVHPVVRTHPESGRQSLFVNNLFTTRILGVSPLVERFYIEPCYDFSAK